MPFGNWFHSFIHHEMGENKTGFLHAVKGRILQKLSSPDDVKGAGLQMVALKGELLR